MSSSLTRWSLWDRYRLARSVRPFVRDRAHYNADEFVEAAEKTAAKHPKEWVVFFSLSDKCCDLGRYSEALKAAKRCVELRPNDLRSVYGLATVYNMLTRAAWSERDESELARIGVSLHRLSGMKPSGVDGNLPRSVEAAQEALREQGLDASAAASEAIRWFEAAHSLAPDDRTRDHIRETLEVLYYRFPHIRPSEAWVLLWDAFESSYRAGAEMMPHDLDGALERVSFCRRCLDKLQMITPGLAEAIGDLRGALDASADFIAITRKASTMPPPADPLPKPKDMAEALSDKYMKGLYDLMALMEQAKSQATLSGRLYDEGCAKVAEYFRNGGRLGDMTVGNGRWDG